MIWISEENYVNGYVPVLREKYSDDEIKELTENSPYQDWTNLAKLVMQIEGISFSLNSGISRKYHIDAPETLAEIKHSFSAYECFLVPNDFRVKRYITQIFYVYEDLTFYRVERFPKSNLERKIKEVQEQMRYIVEPKTLNNIETDIKKTIVEADKNKEYAYKLMQLFAENGFKLSRKIFQIADDEMRKKAYEKRKIREEGFHLRF